MRITQWVPQVLKTKTVTAVMVGTTMLLATTASATGDTTPVPPDLGDIVWPIDLSSIATSVGAAGATMIGIWAIYKIGFRLVRKFISRMGAAV